MSIEKDYSSMISVGLIGVALILAIFFCGTAFIMKLEQDDNMDDVAWTSHVVQSWHRPFGGSTQTVSRIVLGLRRDGVVVWREEHPTALSSSAVFFDDCVEPELGAK